MKMCESLGLNSFEVMPRISLVTYMLANACIFHFESLGGGINGDSYLCMFQHLTWASITVLCLWYLS